MNSPLDPSTQESKLVFTEEAAKKVQSLIDEEGNNLLNLRVYITGGGCSGFQYGFTFDETIQNDDVVIKRSITINNLDESNQVQTKENANNNNAINTNQNGSNNSDNNHRATKKASNNNSNNNTDDDDSSDGGNSNLRVVKLLIDPMSYQYLNGATIDYREDINGSQFVIRNPNAKTTCGCGSSFSI